MQQQAQQPASQELIGTYQRERWRSEDGCFAVHQLDDGKVVTGNSKPGDLIPGLPYRFVGRWESTKHGPSFKFRGFVQSRPHTRDAVAIYLSRNATGIGPRIARKIIDEFGIDDAVAAVKRQPAEVAKRIKGITEDTAKLAAEQLRHAEAWEQTKIDLLDLFAGRGFPAALVDDVIRAFNVRAPERIKRDPFVLLVRKFAGCGFLRCDRLYIELGNEPDRLKRQIICAWHAVETNPTGSTWCSRRWVEQQVAGKVTGHVQPGRAVVGALRAKWLVSRLDEHGVEWLAVKRQADAEQQILDLVGRLAG